MNRGPILTQFQNAEDNFGVVHRAMRLFYDEHCSLEDALMIAVIELAQQNAAMAKAAMFAPASIVISKPSGA
jgi:hypothetical protein